MGDTLNVLFVCTGNIFRSMSAEYLLKEYLEKKQIKGVNVSSAGIIAHQEPADPETVSYFTRKKINIQKHKQRRLTKKILREADVVIAMSKNHKAFIKENLGRGVPLFNKLAYGKETPVLDMGERNGQRGFDNQIISRKKEVQHINKTLTYINKAIPKLWATIEETNLLFTLFVQRKNTHRNGFPPQILHETKHCAAFMSIDIPATEDGHVLVVPKKRYAKLEDIPKAIRSELIQTVTLVGEALMKTHEGYNILLNNGHSAGQYIYHTHFHIIPRNKGDNIEIEQWKRRKKINKKTFKEMNKRIKTEIQNVLRNKKK